METIISGVLIGIGIILIILMCILHDADFFKRIGNVIELKSETKKVNIQNLQREIDNLKYHNTDYKNDITKYKIENSKLYEKINSLEILNKNLKNRVEKYEKILFDKISPEGDNEIKSEI